MSVCYEETDVIWVHGHINPPKSGEYYVILEAQEDAADFKVGDVEVTTDYYNTAREEWEEIGKENPSWKVLCWADIFHPDVPHDIADRVKEYFGTRVETE